MAAPGAQRLQLILSGQAVDEPVEGAEHESVPPRHGEAAHVRPVEGRCEAQRGGLPSQGSEHRREQIEPVDVHACPYAWNEDPPRAASDLEHGTARLAGELEIEVEVEAKLAE